MFFMHYIFDYRKNGVGHYFTNCIENTKNNEKLILS